MFQITNEPRYFVRYEKVGNYRLFVPFDYNENDDSVYVTPRLSGDEADRLIEDLSLQFQQRRSQLPDDRFLPFKVPQQDGRCLYATEQGQELLENCEKVHFVAVWKCTLRGDGVWLLPLARRSLRKYSVPVGDWPEEARFRRFLAGLYSPEDGWILPE